MGEVGSDGILATYTHSLTVVDAVSPKSLA